jgi:segregation and condensation protein B
MDNLTQQVESLVFSTEHPISLEEIKDALDLTFESDIPFEDIQTCISTIAEQYSDERYSFELVEIGGGYQFLSKGAYFNTIGNYLKLTTRKQLSRAALETLAIVAYKQPVSKVELEKIRGVNCDYSIQKLLEKELVTITGRSDGPGRPLLYGTSEKFMDYFGINSLDELPKPRDFKLPDSEIGEAAPVEEEIPANSPSDDEEE